MHGAASSPCIVKQANLAGRIRRLTQGSGWAIGGTGGVPPVDCQFRDGGARRADPMARRRVSINFNIIGVRISCIAKSIFPPGVTMMFGRDMNESWIIDSR